MVIPLMSLFNVEVASQKTLLLASFSGSDTAFNELERRITMLKFIALLQSR